MNDLEETIVQICHKCQIEKPLEMFEKNKKYDMGRSKVCKKCASKRVMKYRNSSIESRESYLHKKHSYLKTEKGRLCMYKYKAKERNLEWCLEDEEASKLFIDSCFYCGCIADPWNGIDRIDNNKGYITENCVTCCKHCNVAKNTQSQEEFILQANRIANLHPR